MVDASIFVGFIQILSPFGSLLLVEDGVSSDGRAVGGGRVPGQGDEPRGGDDGLEVGGGRGQVVQDGSEVAGGSWT